MKKLKFFLCFIGIIALAIGLILAVNKLDEKNIIDFQGGVHIHKLEEPRKVKFETNILYWDASDNAEEYVIKCNGEKITTKETQIDLNSIKPGIYDINIKAIANGYRDSKYVKVEDCKILNEDEKTQEIIKNLNELLEKDKGRMDDLKPIMLFINNDIINYISGSRKNNCLLFSQIKLQEENKNYIVQDIKNNKAELINNYTCDIFSYDSHPNYEVGAPLVGNLKKLKYEGWSINKEFEFYDIIANQDDSYTFKYIVVVNCKKDNKSNYFIQTSNMVDNSEGTWTYNTYNKFNEGVLKNFAVEEIFIALGDLLYYNDQYVNKNNN